MENLKNNDNATFNSDVRTIPEKSLWQDYQNWQVTLINASLVIIFSGVLGGVIYLSRHTVQTLFKQIENDKNIYKSGKISYAVQDVNENYVVRMSNRNKGKAAKNSVSFKFIRINYGSQRAIIYQNVFSVNSEQNLGPLIKKVVIYLSLEELLDPLKHVFSGTFVKADDTPPSGNDDI